MAANDHCHIKTYLHRKVQISPHMLRLQQTARSGFIHRRACSVKPGGLYRFVMSRAPFYSQVRAAVCEFVSPPRAFIYESLLVCEKKRKEVPEVFEAYRWEELYGQLRSLPFYPLVYPEIANLCFCTDAIMSIFSFGVWNIKKNCSCKNFCVNLFPLSTSYGAHSFIFCWAAWAFEW